MTTDFTCSAQFNQNDPFFATEQTDNFVENDIPSSTVIVPLTNQGIIQKSMGTSVLCKTKNRCTKGT